MNRTILRFLTDDDGATTVDWVVLTAALIGLGMVILIPIAFSAEDSSDKVANYISEVRVGYGN